MCDYALRLPTVHCVNSIPIADIQIGNITPTGLPLLWPKVQHQRSMRYRSAIEFVGFFSKRRAKVGKFEPENKGKFENARMYQRVVYTRVYLRHGSRRREVGCDEE